MRRLLVVLFVAAILTPTMVSAQSEKARLTIINQTGADIYLRIDPYTLLTVKYIKPDFRKDKPTTDFTIERGVYKGVEISACGVISTGDLDLTHNLKLNFTPCEEMSSTDNPRYPGEPSMEKCNWLKVPGKANWRFIYIEDDMRLYDVIILDAPGTANYLMNMGYSAEQVGTRLRHGFALDAQETAQILKDIGFSAVEVSAVLYDVFSSSARDVYEVLKTIFSLNIDEARLVLKELFSDDQVVDALLPDLAVKFAPQLRLDSGSWNCPGPDSYPMSAQDYFTTKRQNPEAELNNSEESTILNNQIPIYWKSFTCGNQIRLVYWIFYGYQYSCDCGFSRDEPVHDADWEHILVVLSEDTTRIAAVTYYQHSGSYTRLAARGGFDAVEGTHPVVYVGRTNHGSYHNDQTSFQTCCYWEDHRDGDGPIMDSWLGPVIRMQPTADGGEPWMDEDIAKTFKWGEISQHPMNNSSGGCGEQTCDGTTTWGCHTSGCFRSQCEIGDRDDGLATCWHCASGYTDCGFFCAKGWESEGISTYGFEYTIPTSDKGLLYKNPGW